MGSAWFSETDPPNAFDLTLGEGGEEEDMEVDDITSELGVKNIMEKLKDYFHPHLEVSLPRAFETAVCGTPRQSKESFAEYVKRMERSFAHLAKEGVDLPDSARGYIHFRQASLSEPQE